MLLLSQARGRKGREKRKVVVVAVVMMVVADVLLTSTVLYRPKLQNRLPSRQRPVSRHLRKRQPVGRTWQLQVPHGRHVHLGSCQQCWRTP